MEALSRCGGGGLILCSVRGLGLSQVGWTERKVMEAAVLSGVLADKLHTCVVAAGLVYDQEGGDLQHLVR